MFLFDIIAIKLEAAARMKEFVCEDAEEVEYILLGFKNFTFMFFM